MTAELYVYREQVQVPAVFSDLFLLGGIGTLLIGVVLVRYREAIAEEASWHRQHPDTPRRRLVDPAAGNELPERVDDVIWATLFRRQLMQPARPRYVLLASARRVLLYGVYGLGGGVFFILIGLLGLAG